MTLAEADSYFSDIASKMVDIAHTEAVPKYGHYHIEEVLTGLRENLDMTGFCLLLEDPSGQIYKTASEQVKDLQTAAILILKHVPLDDFASERIVLDRALYLCKQVAARMIKDQELAIMGEKPRWLRGLQVQGFAYQKGTELFDRCFGYRLEYQYMPNESLVINPADWIS
ncbi:hypothetical protein PBT90_16785 [Algoriphagus halophytocola]|uniref:hypothetical protein n=1 Tax=Algoriphagus halophytocola TaxID=2991499 RepID=UPI0022DD3463|nr:hypothetical protein [Algoriphagus sp. TR-M9]WBL42394.1 hypothetical protein PBT90_16785 [Algoriphagus sp. TR-M9]